MTKTNAMRILDKNGIKYTSVEYEVDESDLSGISAAAKTQLPPEMMFKTLTLKGDKSGFVVFCIPVNRELDLKKCAAISKNKKVELVAVKDLLMITGYIRGGCSPIGMKKAFPTYFDIDVTKQKDITISAGCRGCQLIVDSKELLDFLKAEIVDVSI